MAALIGIALSITAGFRVSLWEDRHAVLEFNAIAENQYMAPKRAQRVFEQASDRARLVRVLG
jgi:hypothetical protein